MEDKVNKKDTSDEIDLSYVFQKIGVSLKSLFIGFLELISFYYKKKWMLLSLIVLGGVLGYFWENYKEDKFKNNFVVASNYGSSDYLYNKIKSIDSKLELQDTLFLKMVFGKHYSDVKSLDVEPIVDIYNFIGQSESNKELFELLSDDVPDVPEFVKEPINSRNYPHHMVKLIIENESVSVNKTISKRFFTFLNDNEYFNKAKEISLNNTLLQIDQNKEVRSQIDQIVKKVADQGSIESQKTMVSIQDNKVLDDLLKRKDETLNEDKRLKINLANMQQVIKIIDANYLNKYDETLLSKDKKLLAPLLLIILFSLIYLIRYLVSSSQRFLAQNKN